jgi:uncharacterized membrane protein YjjP (DUF1212 family)
MMSSTSKPSVTSSFDRKTTYAALSDAVEVLLSFGALMLRAGNTATRTREWIEVLARKLGFDAVSVSLSLDSITASVRRSGERATIMREIGPSGINAWRIAELEQLAKTLGPDRRRAKSQSGLRKSSRRHLGIPACRLPQPSAWLAVPLHF